MHKEIQKRFFSLITSQEPLYASLNNPIQTYKELIHYRFKEVILSTFERFCSHLKESHLDELITAFIQSCPQTPLIWQMPNEFRHFLSREKSLKSLPFMDDLLWFEWVEVELFMNPYQTPKEEYFDWNQAYRLSESALLRELNFPVFHQENYHEGGIYPLLVYYHFETHEVHFQELTPFLKQFVDLLNDHTAQDALEKISAQFEVDEKEVQKLLQEPLESFVENYILQSKEL